MCNAQDGLISVFHRISLPFPASRSMMSNCYIHRSGHLITTRSISREKRILDFAIFQVEAKYLWYHSNWALCICSYLLHSLLIFIIPFYDPIDSFKSFERGAGIKVKQGGDERKSAYRSFIWLWETSRELAQKKVEFHKIMQMAVSWTKSRNGSVMRHRVRPPSQSHVMSPHLKYCVEKDLELT